MNDIDAEPVEARPHDAHHRRVRTRCPVCHEAIGDEGDHRLCRRRLFQRGADARHVAATLCAHAARLVEAGRHRAER